MPCTSAEKQVFEWDEVGRLQETYKVEGFCSSGGCDFTGGAFSGDS
jgi:hypothetical protein